MHSNSKPIGLTPRRLGWGDAVFFPKPNRLLELDTANVLKLCAIWHDVYQAFDHCLWLLDNHQSPEVRKEAEVYAGLVHNLER
jgi:hypothetical protein